MFLHSSGAAGSISQYLALAAKQVLIGTGSIYVVVVQALAALVAA